MRYFFLLCCFLFSAQHLCAQKKFKKKKGEYSYTNPDGNRESGMIADHLAEGEWITYFGKTKTVKLKTTYVHGEATGKTEEYNSKGILTATGYYLDGYADSVWTYYYSTGEISETRTYSKGKLHGELKHYAPDGIVFKRYTFVQNEMRSFEAFDYTGKPLGGEYYKNGQKHGRCWDTKGWTNPDSLHRNYCDYANDKKHGEQKKKEIPLDRVTTRHWSNDSLIGAYTLTTVAGNMIEEGNYIDALPVGKWKSYSQVSFKLERELWYSLPVAPHPKNERYYAGTYGDYDVFPDSVYYYAEDGRLEKIERRKSDYSFDTVLYPKPGEKKITDTVEEESDTDIDITPGEVLPEYPGGNDALYKFLELNVKYPKAAADAGIQGVVYTRFVVDVDGTPKDFELAKGVHPILDKEAMRVVQLMPKWKPGMINGRKVAVAYTLPVKFKLQ
jgi:TonB family protein